VTLPQRPGSDPLRKMRFREAAREIVARIGTTGNTACPWTRREPSPAALERAYRQGFLEAQSDPSRPKPRTRLPHGPRSSGS